MKKILSLLLTIMLCLSLSSCQVFCSHTWKNATCLSPKTCTQCGATEGTISNHSWADATCVSPRTCTVCNKTEGTKSSSHTYTNNKCDYCGTVQLTLDNYKDYLDISARAKCGDYYGHGVANMYTGVICSIDISGNSNYEYNNVSLVVEFIHYDDDGFETYLLKGSSAAVPHDSKRCYIDLNLSGKGSDSCTLLTPWDASPSQAWQRDSDEILQRTTFKIISISGTATKN